MLKEGVCSGTLWANVPRGWLWTRILSSAPMAASLSPSSFPSPICALSSFGCRSSFSVTETYWNRLANTDNGSGLCRRHCRETYLWSYGLCFSVACRKIHVALEVAEVVSDFSSSKRWEVHDFRARSRKLSNTLCDSEPEHLIGGMP